MIKVLIVDDHMVVRRGLSSLLESEEGLEVVGQAADGFEAIEQAEKLQPDVVLLDVEMPRLNGLVALPSILEKSPHSKVIILSTFADDERIFGALRAGASGYVLKDVAEHDLIEYIRKVVRGEPALAPQVAHRLISGVSQPHPKFDDALNTISDRERQVLRLVGQGLSNKEIAARLSFTESTAKAHVHSLLTKLGLADRTQLALYAVKNGLEK
ncbi:MAG: response regulator transcription factor [Chloroflexi bacterium]|nr:response regulator transcription factor [Chloroflexota bacterium]